MRTAFAHDAVLSFAADGDEREPGAVVTAALCGRVEHEPPCPLAAHHTAAARDGDAVRLRILFACAPADEPEVRRRIGTALSARWPVLSSGASPVRPEESAHAARLAGAVSR
ncbi:hypothetical protein [Spirilliplanes yamanashiensis]|uniref:Uncharacterized protein n=1 Tax=Spirilliplanes yamanashiensis TaxID=42233 RepID=A0A8J3Y7Q5_9ACTN|nr:hypothetical protein [Spirilliplanes yamanashiensis]MDP9816878.1 hypothetical protein [Spirilliplanes yamanashiensis]GIJ03466.1 hypothetical protein Sya03_28180 [Spirilliplanes yamanashiensis]